MQKKETRFNLFFLDCCRVFQSGGPTKSLQNTWDNPKNTLLYFACGPNQTASDGFGGNGMDFSTHGNTDSYKIIHCENPSVVIKFTEITIYFECIAQCFRQAYLRDVWRLISQLKGCVCGTCSTVSARAWWQDLAASRRRFTSLSLSTLTFCSSFSALRCNFLSQQPCQCIALPFHCFFVLCLRLDSCDHYPRYLNRNSWSENKIWLASSALSCWSLLTNVTLCWSSLWTATSTKKFACFLLPRLLPPLA